ncbi:hypothetical protein ACIQVN_31690 [Streptomyces cyaneofuscatus]|uniref:hypothetical protein n=1 Tax=Streptomyces cyaneofuscatus TaxID=66883 RepID=UPI0038114671
MVDQDETGGLVLGAFALQDVEPDGTVSSGIVASFVYPDSPERRARARALGAASHMVSVGTLAPLTRSTGRTTAPCS